MMNLTLLVSPQESASEGAYKLDVFDDEGKWKFALDWRAGDSLFTRLLQEYEGIGLDLSLADLKQAHLCFMDTRDGATARALAEASSTPYDVDAGSIVHFISMGGALRIHNLTDICLIESEYIRWYRHRPDGHVGYYSESMLLPSEQGSAMDTSANLDILRTSGGGGWLSRFVLEQTADAFANHEGKGSILLLPVWSEDKHTAMFLRALWGFDRVRRSSGTARGDQKSVEVAEPLFSSKSGDDAIALSSPLAVALGTSK